MSNFMKIGNAFMKGVLRSPFHGMLSSNTLCISFQGRKSGKTYSIPTNYSQDGKIVRIVSFKQRVWWKNLRGGVPVTLRLRGDDIQGHTNVLESEDEVVEGLSAYLKSTPNFAKYFEVRMEQDGTLNLNDLTQAAKSRVIIEVAISP